MRIHAKTPVKILSCSPIKPVKSDLTATVYSNDVNKKSASQQSLMSIVILVGGRSNQGNYEHRYMVSRFLERFSDQVSTVLTTDPVKRSIPEKIKRTVKRGGYAERIARILYNRSNPGDPELLGKLLFPEGAPAAMPGAERIRVVSGHNAKDCEALIRAAKPEVIVVYGTMLIRDHIAELSSVCTLNMHTGLSPYYRGDSTLFWPIYYNQKDKLGVTVHELVSEVDGGGIVYTGKVDYEAGDTETHIFAKGVRKGADLYLQAVVDALDGKIKFHTQDLDKGREFRWIDRTVAAEKQVKKILAEWNEQHTG